MQLVLGSAVPHGEGYTETARPEAPTLLQQLQDHIRADRLPAGSAGGDVDRRPLLDSDDDSIRVHSCHGWGRQVEVLPQRHPPSARGRSLFGARDIE